MRSIRLQIMSFISGLLLILMLLLNTYPIRSSQDAIFEEKRKSMGARAGLLATTLAALDRLSEDAVDEVLDFLELEGFDRILVADANGDVVYDMTSGAEDGFPEDVRTALDGKTVFRSSFRHTAFSSSMTMPMSNQGHITGTVYLHEYDTERARIIQGIQNQIRIFSLVFCAAALAIAEIYASAMMRKMRDLVRSMQKVAGGDYSYRHIVRGRDEISELGQEFNFLTERLETTEKQRRRFVSDASHELKTPLAAIRLLADSIVQNEGMARETVQEFASDIGNEAKRLQNTTEKLMRLSLSDDGVRYAPKPVDVKETARSVLSPLLPLAREKQVQLETEMEDGCIIMGSSDELFPVIFNLVENAIKYNLPGGTVRLRVWKEEKQVLLTVEDTGIGIPKEDIPFIFDRFYRVDKARSREAGGSGLGLSIVHDAVRNLGGSITVGKNLPQGTVFTVCFPRPNSEEKEV